MLHRLPVRLHAITVFFQSPVVRARALEPVHVDATYVAEHAERAAAVPVLANGHLEHAAARHRLHDQQVFAATGYPVHPAPGRHGFPQRQVRASVPLAHRRPVLGQYRVQLPYHVLAAVHRRLAAPVQFFVFVANAPMRRDAGLFARPVKKKNRHRDVSHCAVSRVRMVEG